MHTCPHCKTEWYPHFKESDKTVWERGDDMKVDIKTMSNVGASMECMVCNSKISTHKNMARVEPPHDEPYVIDIEKKEA